MPNKGNFILSAVADGKILLNALMTFLFKYEKTATITFWGDLPKSLIENLKKYNADQKTARMRIAKEHDFLVSQDGFNDFMDSLEPLDLNKISWGIRINEEGIILARSRDDVNIISSAAIPEGAIEDYLLELQNLNIIGAYERVED